MNPQYKSRVLLLIPLPGKLNNERTSVVLYNRLINNDDTVGVVVFTTVELHVSNTHIVTLILKPSYSIVLAILSISYCWNGC